MMFLRQSGRKDGRKYLQIVHGYRDSQGKSKAKVIQSLGYLDELAQKYQDPIAHFKEIAKNMESERKQSKSHTLEIRSDAVVGGDLRKNYGCVVFSQIYHELELDRFFNNKSRHAGFEYNANSIAKLLTFARLIYPGSKKNAHELKEKFFDILDFSLDDVYHSLSFFNRTARDCQKHMHQMICEKYGRETDLVYYDVTNYYFETEHEDEFRKKGYSQKHRRGPVVQMGLAVDKQGIPISYKLFKGNTHDSQTLMPVLDTGTALAINEEKIRQEELLDGYYAIVTGELDKPDDEIIELYRGLWPIEESFKITKSVVDARPVYVYKPEHINAHFLLCFIALTLARLVELKLGKQFPVAKIIASLRQVECSHLDANHWLFDYADDVTGALNAMFDVDFGKKFMTTGEIKKYFARAKK